MGLPRLSPRLSPGRHKPLADHEPARERVPGGVAQNPLRLLEPTPALRQGPVELADAPRETEAAPLQSNGAASPMPGVAGAQANGTGPSVASAAERALSAEPRLEVIAGSLGETRSVCDVLSAQLDAVLGETESAAVGFIERVQSIDGAVNTLSERMQELVGRSDRQAIVLEEMARDNAAAVEDLRRFIEERNETVRALVEEVRELDRYGRSIQEVASTSKVLAINALIEAAHAGAAGAGFGVVAKHIQELARTSDTAARELQSGIDELTSRILDELGANRGDGGDGGADSGISSQFVVHLRGIAAGQSALAQHVADVRRAVEEADGATRDVAELASGIADNVQFQDITRQATEQVKRALGRLADHSELLIAYSDGRERPETVQECRYALDDMVNEYVLQRQRATHARVALGDNGVSEQDGPAIELF